MDTYVTATETFETEYAEQGAGHAVVLLHGWGASKRIWRAFWPHAVTRWRAIAPDLPGWGGSGKPDGAYTPAWYSRWLRTFLDARGVERADLVAHSMGTMAAVLFASEQPERVRRLVLSNPPVEGARAFSRRTYRLTSPLNRWVLHTMLGLRSVRRWATKDFTYATPWDDQDVDGLLRSTYASMVRTVDGMVAADVRPAMAAVRAPALVIGTTMDAVVRPEQASIASRTLPHARLAVIEDSGHCPMLEQPEEFARLVTGFLAEDQAPKRPRQW